MGERSHKLEDKRELKELQNELAFFKRVRKRLLKDRRYARKFIALKNHQIIDYDTDDFRLAKRIDEQYPLQAVLIVKVEKNLPQYELPSPELV